MDHIHFFDSTGEAISTAASVGLGAEFSNQEQDASKLVGGSIGVFGTYNFEGISQNCFATAGHVVVECQDANAPLYVSDGTCIFNKDSYNNYQRRYMYGINIALT